MDYQSKAKEIAGKYNITVTYRQCRGYAHPKTRSIETPEPKGYVSFFTFLHEVGHIVAPNASYQTAPTRALAEHRATKWAYAQLREMGMPIKATIKTRYTNYIKNKIARGLRRGGNVPVELTAMAKGVSKRSYF